MSSVWMSSKRWLFLQLQKKYQWIIWFIVDLHVACTQCYRHVRCRDCTTYALHGILSSINSRRKKTTQRHDQLIYKRVHRIAAHLMHDTHSCCMHFCSVHSSAIYNRVGYLSKRRCKTTFVGHFSNERKKRFGRKDDDDFFH